MKNREIADIFYRLADALEFKGEMAFKVVSYRRAARIIEDMSEDIAETTRQGRLREVEGIGESIARKVEEYLATGKIARYEEAVKGIPAGLLDLLAIQHVGPRTLALLHRELKVNGIADLKRVIDDGSLARLPRMGEKNVENIRRGIEIFEQAQARMPIYEAVEVSERVIAYLHTCRGVGQVEASGSLRRMRETVGDIDILVTGKDGAAVVDCFTRFPEATQTLAAGDTRGSIVVGRGKLARQVDVRIVPAASFGAALAYFTGSKAHNVKLRGIAKDRGWKLNEYGLFKGNRLLAGRTEQELYARFGLPVIAPEMREDRGEIEAALAGSLPRIIEPGDLRGDLHVHSRYSDGNLTLPELARLGRELGYAYLAVCDHSKSAAYAGGQTESQLRRRIDETAKVNARLKGFRLLAGTEVDIRTDGTLDYPDSVLAELDIVVASIHSGFRKNVTERMVAALENEHVDILGHPTGRLISQRAGYDVDLERVLEAARKHGKAMELNAYYDRLDLNETNLRHAKELGIKIALGTDAHNEPGLRMMRFGVGIARRAWLARPDVLNCRTLAQLLKALKKGKT